MLVTVVHSVVKIALVIEQALWRTTVAIYVSYLDHNSR